MSNSNPTLLKVHQLPGFVRTLFEWFRQERKKTGLYNSSHSLLLKGKCNEVCDYFMAKHPGMFTKQAGFISWPTVPSSTEISHYWLVNAEGQILDPTVEQFQECRGYRPKYRVINLDADPIKLGHCVSCGKVTKAPYNSETARNWFGFCIDGCEQQPTTLVTRLRA